MEAFWSQFNENTIVLLSLFTILVSGFLLTRLTNALKLPRVSGYIIAGVVIGPCLMHLIPEVIVARMGFVSDIALAFIAFGVGKFFKKEVLQKTGKEVILITVSEALVAGILVSLSMHYIFRLSWEFSLVLGAIATATAPASTMMTINQYKAKGEFVNTLLQVVALDDVVCLLAFSIVSAWVTGRESGELSFASVALPIVWNLLAILLGALCGFILSKLLTPQRSRDNRLILVIAMLCGISGICAAFDISPLLSCMVLGAVYINLTKDKKLYRQIGNFTPPVMSIFFIVSGMNMDLNSFKAVGLIGVAYFFIRILGKYLGTYLSCKLTGKSPEICKYMGFALVPQAGVAIGLAFLGRRLLPEEAGTLVMTIILSSSVLYELVGPICAKKALILAGTIPPERLAGELSKSSGRKWGLNRKAAADKRAAAEKEARGKREAAEKRTDISKKYENGKHSENGKKTETVKKSEPVKKAEGEKKSETGKKSVPGKKSGEADKDGSGKIIHVDLVEKAREKKKGDTPKRAGK